MKKKIYRKDHQPLNDAQRDVVAEHYKIACLAANRLQHLYEPVGIDVDDAISAAWIGMCKAAPTYNPETSKPSTYFYVACCHAIMHEIRKMQADKRRAIGCTRSLDTPMDTHVSNGGFDSFCLDNIVTAKDGSPNIYHDLYASDPAAVYEVKDELNVRMSAIPERDRQMFILWYLGWKQRELAPMFGLTTGGIGVSLVRSRKIMQGVAC